MSNFLRKGKRTDAKKRIKEAEDRMAEFSKTLLAMSSVYQQLNGREDLTEDNILEEIGLISDFEFTDGNLNILKKDLLNANNSE